AIWRVSQAGMLQGLRGIESRRLLVIKPYGLAGAHAFSGQPWSALHTGGADIKYGLATNLIAVGAVNTDFSDADVDQQQFNLTPNPIQIPEKRRFFLEDSDVFDFLLWNQDLLFFTRQIGIDPVSGQEVPIDFGGKMAGHASGLDLGIMDVRTRAEGPNPYANYAIVRVKRPLTPGSYIGFMATDKQSGSPLDPYNRSGGVDAKFVLFGNLNLRGYYAKSWTSGLQGDNAALGGRLTYANNWFNIYAGHGVTEKNFNAEMGFVTRIDDQPTIFQFNFTPRPHVLNIRELDLGGFVGHDPNTAGKLIYKEWTPNIRVLFNSSAEIDSAPHDVVYQFLGQPLHLYKNVFIPTGGYRFASHRFPNATTFVQTDTAQNEAVSANFRVRYTFRPDSDLYVIYNVGNRFQSIVAGNPMELREQKFAVKVTYSWSR